MVIALISGCACALAGCGEFRGIPSHGGGKRFDEEQRAVAGAIRQTVADLELAELAGKRVQVVIECVSTDGGGVVVFPGLNSIGAGINGNLGSGDLVQVIPPTVPGGTGFLKNDNSSNNFGGNMGANILTQTAYSPTAMSTAADVAYLRAALEMKARHAGLVPTPAGAEVDAVLHVLIDVLGTNRSHADRILASSERLVATCECTYYAIDAKQNRIIFEARRASAASSYNEQRYLGDKNAHVSRTLYRTRPTRLPVDEPDKPTTQPAIPYEIIADIEPEAEITGWRR
jgi:hypothetical protein